MIRRARAVHLATLLLAAASPACGGDDENTAAGAGGAPSSTSSGTSDSSSNSTTSSTTTTGAGGCDAECDAVHGTAINGWVGETATVEVAQDLSAATIEALVSMGNGQWQTIAGQGNQDGSFMIPGVPDGPSVVHFIIGSGVSSYVYTSARDIDLGTEIAGRPDVVAPAVAPTNLIADLTNLDPWEDSDDIEWLVPNSNAWTTVKYANPVPENPPAVNDVEVNALTLDWSGAYGSALIDKDKGDVLTLLQLSTRQGPGNVSYTVATRFASFDDLAQMDGATVTTNGAFTSVPQDQTAPLDLRATEFASYIPAVNPNAIDTGFGTYVVTLPGVAMYGGFGNSADLFSVDLGVGSADVDLGAVTYGNPYPAAWGASIFAVNRVRVPFTAPGATSALNRPGLMVVVGDVATVTTGPIQPKMTPVQDLEVNGMSAFSDLTGVTETPTLSWTAPAIGTPSFYFIHVEQLTNNGGATTAMVIANLYTKSTTIDLPPGVFAQGNTYFVRVRATSAAIDVEAHPLRRSGVIASADTFSNTITP